MTKIINFTAGPSAGKSTLSSELFAWMKKQRMNVEFAPEFAKEATWKGHKLSLEDQLYIFGEQHHRIYSLINQVDWIVTDSPLILQLHYCEESLDKYKDNFHEDIIWAFKSLLTYVFNAQDNVVFFVNRGDRKFIQAGRNENEEQSKEIDLKIRELLKDNFIPYKSVSNLSDVLKELQFHE